MICTTFAFAVISIFTLASTAPLPIRPRSPAAQNTYITYRGDGSPAAGWPTRTQWLTFEEAWTASLPTIQNSCTALASGPNNDASETAAIKSSIAHEAASSLIPAEFILAILMQESSGCVRAPTTLWQHANPGLMQTAMGRASCNVDGEPVVPCPEETIARMIHEGTSTSSGLGTTLESCVKDAGAGVGTQDDGVWYRAARIYNGGHVEGGDLGVGPTPCYASDVANRLVRPFAQSGCEAAGLLVRSDGDEAPEDGGVELAPFDARVQRTIGV
ncbi:hypothetical protein P153DRAFT_300971 [Dothidotthia symphoricarpi CBS 119687]|uniref:Glycoside hydrolase family 23 protein n=1 Tax=Dothidotthia symphoricarpi CBS 119687 TaxID=1392245 RepID=A0A6A6A0Q6_9PLEO|nr:uncharacterized protein P153DRAFT_300971 [Dothidotthia symphoricarpi CBS 119687]KAF2125116.1 hypothetical protein P153DRAFT_300971 [Dothidotthia symphoricarpi CBS 119687]